MWENFDKYLNEKSFLGSIQVSKSGQTIYQFRKTTHTDNEKDLYRIASLTKPFTAFAIVKLIEDGILTVEDRLKDFFDFIPSSWDSVTIFELLTHTSGIPDLFSDMSVVGNNEMLSALRDTLHKDTSEFQSGNYFSYSNFNYILLGLIIEKVSRSSYHEYLTKEIFTPLEMNSTQLEEFPEENLISGNEIVDNNVIQINYTNPAAFSAGGLLSTIEDMNKFTHSVIHRTLFNNSTYASVFTPYKENYGLGWKVVTQYRRLAYQHSGGSKGFNTHFAIYPDDEVSIIVFSNIENFDTQSIACGIAKILFDNTLPNFCFPETNENDLKDWIGEYKSNDRIIDILSEENTLYYRLNEEIKYEVICINQNSGYMKIAPNIEFKLEGSNITLKLVIFRCGSIVSEYQKIET